MLIPEAPRTTTRACRLSPCAVKGTRIRQGGVALTLTLRSRGMVGVAVVQDGRKKREWLIYHIHTWGVYILWVSITVTAIQHYMWWVLKAAMRLHQSPRSLMWYQSFGLLLEHLLMAAITIRGIAGWPIASHRPLVQQQLTFCYEWLWNDIEHASLDLTLSGVSYNEKSHLLNSVVLSVNLPAIGDN